MVRNAPGIVMKFVEVPSSMLIMPVGASRMRTIPQRTMTEMKLGMYSTSWIFCLVLAEKMRLSRKASRIGAGKPQSRPNTLSFRVFIRYRMKSGDERNRWKCSKPTHSLPKMPRIGLYSVKAIMIPPMGMYRKITVSKNAGSMKIAYSCQC